MALGKLHKCETGSREEKQEERGREGEREKERERRREREREVICKHSSWMSASEVKGHANFRERKEV